MTETDIKTGRELIEEDFIKKNPEWQRVSASCSPPDCARAFVCSCPCPASCCSFTV
jgi:hypothetical protein